MNKIQHHDFMATAAQASSDTTSFISIAAKTPSSKAVKKAAAVLKQKNAAKIASLIKVVEKPISKLVELKKVRDGKIDELGSKIDKKKTEIQRLTEASEKIWDSSLPKVDKLAARAVKAIDAVVKAGGKYTPPASIVGYIDAARSGLIQADAAGKKKKKALGKGLKDLTGGDKGKTKKSVKQMTSESSNAASHVYDVDDSAVDVRNLITDAFDEFTLGRKMWNPKSGEAQPNTVRWDRKNAHSPATKFGPARKHFQQITCLSSKVSDKNEMLELIESVIEEAGANSNVTYLTGHMVIELKSSDGSNFLIFEDGTAGWTLSHNFNKG